MTVAELVRTHGPEVLAKRDGFCKGCTDPVTAREDYIAKVDGIGWMHAFCAASYCRIFEEHQEDNDGTDGAREESS